MNKKENKPMQTQEFIREIAKRDDITLREARGTFQVINEIIEDCIRERRPLKIRGSFGIEVQVRKNHTEGRMAPDGDTEYPDEYEILKFTFPENWKNILREQEDDDEWD